MGHRLLFTLLALGLGAPAAWAAPAGWHPRVAFTHLAPLEASQGRYMLWASAKEHDYMAGAFVVDAHGDVCATAGPSAPVFTLALPPASVEDLYVTLEAPTGSPTSPSKQIFLRGAPRGGHAVLEPPIQAADYTQASGAFVLDDPVTADPNDFNGLWFSRYLSRRYVPALELPEAPDGWMYEGWVLYQGIPLRTGKFRTGIDPSDWDGYSGRSASSALIDMGMPPMPGQDFVTHLPTGVPDGPNQPDLSGVTVLVTLENATLAGEEHFPSPLHIFEGHVPVPARHNQTYPLKNVTSQWLPAGTVTLP